MSGATASPCGISDVGLHKAGEPGRRAEIEDFRRQVPDDHFDRKNRLREWVRGKRAVLARRIRLPLAGRVENKHVARPRRIGGRIQAAVRQNGDDLGSVVGQRKEGGRAWGHRNGDDVRCLSLMDNLNVGARKAVQPVGCLGVDLVCPHEEQGNRLAFNQNLRVGQFPRDSAGVVELCPHSFIRSDAGTEDRDDLARSEGTGEKNWRH